MEPMQGDEYPPIGDYALIGDCHSAALISTRGSIDWCCLPRFDSDSCFGRILDWKQGGHCAITPADPNFSASRAYLEDTLILVMTFRTEQGEARLYDFFAMREGGREHPRRELIRVLEGVAGEVAFAIEIVPRLDYGETTPWIYRYGEHTFAAVGSNEGLVVASDIEFEVITDCSLKARLSVRKGDRYHLSVQFVPPERVDSGEFEIPDPRELDRRLEETREWWKTWADKISVKDAGRACVMRSAIVLKALQFAPTGAIIAAPTTSLPEGIGAERNWDYRYSWLRDSIFTVHSLANLGCESEADGFRRFVQRSAAGSSDELQVLYGCDGRRRIPEIELEFLEGYRRSRPVRIGNGAERQFQADMYGLVLELAWRWAQRGNSPDPAYWKFLTRIVEAAIQRWQEPDRGIWEVRSEPRHFVHSKVMCWAAVNRGVALCESFALSAPAERWRAAREEMRAVIEDRGYDRSRGIFVQAFGERALDAALLLLPEVEFVDYGDARMVRTVDAICEELNDHGLILRYRTDDGLRGTEGVFLACSFWLAGCLARQNRREAARQWFDRAMDCANDVGLFPEEYDPRSGLMLGNFPQGLTHLAHVSAALALSENSA